MIAILAYGSLIKEKGEELKPFIDKEIPTLTPFPVEFARYSRTRGGGPTVVPHIKGRAVNAKLLVLKKSVTLDEAKDILWRRETGNEGSNKKYKKSESINAVLIEEINEFYGIEHVLYTDFNAIGKIENPDSLELAKAAIASVGKATSGKDGISYLKNLVKSDIVTELMPKYIQCILELTNAKNLDEALERLTGGDIK